MYLTFGAIDYEAQSNLLIKEAISPLVIFSDKSQTGKKLAQYEEEAFKYTTVEVEIIDDNATQESGLFDLFQDKPEKQVEYKKVLNEYNKVVK